MKKVDKKWWKQETKKYKFSPSKVRLIGNNQYILSNASKFRIVSITTPGGFSGKYIIDGYVDGDWKFIKNTWVTYSTPDNKWHRDYENAYNRCKKIARKFPEIKMKNLIMESGVASMMYGSTGYKKVELKDI